jgi:hypothetical protein
MKKSFLIICLVLSLTLSGCQLFNSSAGINESATSGTLLFSDDFTSNTHSWGTEGKNIGEISFVYDGLDLKVDTPNSLLWTVAQDQFKDSQVEVDAVLLNGPTNDAFGVVCRFKDNDNFYGFLVSHDGYYGIFRMQDGSMTLANGQSGLTYSEAIRQGGVVNHIQAVCQGNTLRLKVNGTLLAEIQDDAFTQGQVGLIVGTYETAGVEVFFDNLLVYQP